MQRSSTLITPHYSPSTPFLLLTVLSTPRLIDPLRLRERSRRSHSLCHIPSTVLQPTHQATIHSSLCLYCLLRFAAAGILVTPAAHRQPPATPPLVSSHTRIQIFHHTKPSTPHFFPLPSPIFSSLQPHYYRQQQPPSLPFAPDYPPKFSYCLLCTELLAAFATLFHPQNEPNLYRPIVGKIHRACPGLSPGNAVCAVESEL